MLYTALKIRLTNAASQASTATEQHLYLQRMQAGQATHRDWLNWGMQRYQAASQFSPLIKAGLQKASLAGLLRTAEELRQNLCEEEGIDSRTGETLPIVSHEDWRVEFYKALGLEPQDLKRQILPSTTEYKTTIEGIISQAWVWEHAGALMAAERAICNEMKMIDHGLINTWCLSDRFNILNDKQPSRRYVTHHAGPYAERQFSDLRDAIVDDLFAMFKNSDARERAIRKIMSGMRQIAQAREKFYDGLEIDFLG